MCKHDISNPNPILFAIGVRPAFLPWRCGYFPCRSRSSGFIQVWKNNVYESPSTHGWFIEIWILNITWFTKWKSPLPNACLLVLFMNIKISVWQYRHIHTWAPTHIELVEYPQNIHFPIYLVMIVCGHLLLTTHANYQEPTCGKSYAASESPFCNMSICFIVWAPQLNRNLLLSSCETPSLRNCEQSCCVYRILSAALKANSCLVTISIIELLFSGRDIR